MGTTINTFQSNKSKNQINHSSDSCHTKFIELTNNQMAKTDKYSSILQDFARPLLNGNECLKDFTDKIKYAELIWNYCIVEELQLKKLPEEMDSVFKESDAEHPEMRETFLLLRSTKSRHFKKYKNFILKTEIRQTPDGSLSVYVEFIEPQYLKERYEQIRIEK